MSKTFQSFLMDDNARERIRCKRANWTGVAYKIPRSSLKRCNDLEDLKQSGIYILLGVSDDTGKGIAYIGQANARKNDEGLLNRLMEHNRDPKKDYWSEAIAFTTSNNSLGATELNYLEHTFCIMAQDAKRYVITNRNTPNIGNITDDAESELQEFIDNAKDVMVLLGHKLFEPLDEPKTAENSTEPESDILYLERIIRKTGETVKARAKQTSEGFVVLRGSYVSQYEDETILDSIKKFRKDASIDANRILQEDMLFHSSSTAAIFVIGKSASGPLSWKTADGKTLDELNKMISSGN